MNKDLKNLKVVELKQIAKDNNIKGYSKLRKLELINIINETINIKSKKQNIIVDKKKSKREQMNDIIKELENIEREILQISKNVHDRYPPETYDRKPIVIRDTLYDRYLDKTLDRKINLYKYQLPTPIFNKDIYAPSIKLYDRAFKLIDIGTKLTPLFNKSINSKFITDIINKGYKDLEHSYNERKKMNEKYGYDVRSPYGFGMRKRKMNPMNPKSKTFFINEYLFQ